MKHTDHFLSFNIALVLSSALFSYNDHMSLYGWSKAKCVAEPNGFFLFAVFKFACFNSRWQPLWEDRCLIVCPNVKLLTRVIHSFCSSSQCQVPRRRLRFDYVSKQLKIIFSNIVSSMKSDQSDHSQWRNCKQLLAEFTSSSCESTSSHYFKGKMYCSEQAHFFQDCIGWAKAH